MWLAYLTARGRLNSGLKRYFQNCNSTVARQATNFHVETFHLRESEESRGCSPQ